MPGDTRPISEPPRPSGIQRYDGESWRSFTMDDDLQFQHILSIPVDRQGNVWCSTAYELARFSIK